MGMDKGYTEQMLRRLSDWLFAHPGLALASVLAVALVTRLLGIASRLIWYDEAFSILFSQKGFATMLTGTLASTGGGAAEEHPLLYYMLLSAWMRAFGDSVVAVRLFSIVAGMILVSAVYLLARSLFDVRIGFVAGLITALSPFQVHYAQEIRMYSLLGAWLLLATYAYWRAARSSGPGWWLAFALFAALAQYTHNLAAFYLLALAIWPILKGNWHVAKRVALAGLLALLLYAPWLVYLPSQFAKVDHSYWVGKPAVYRLLTLLLFYVPSLPLPDTELSIGLTIAVFVVAIAALWTVSAVRSRQSGAEQGMWLLYLSFAPAVLLFVFSQWIPLYLERALLPSGAVFCAWLAWAIFGTRAPHPLRLLAGSLLVIAFAMGLYHHVASQGGLYGPFQTVTHNLEAELQPGDVIVHSNKLSMLPSVYFDPMLSQSYVADPQGSGVDTFAPATQQALGVIARPDLQTAVKGARRVWFIIFDRSIQEYVKAGYATHPQIAWLSQHFSLVEARTWATLHVYLFAKEP